MTRINGRRYSPAMCSGHLILTLDRSVGGATAHGEVVAENNHRSAVDRRATEHAVGGHEIRHDPGTEIVRRLAGDRAEFQERIRVGQPIDPFADGEFAGVVLAFDALGTAHLAGDPLAFAQLLEFGLPARG